MKNKHCNTSAYSQQLQNTRTLSPFIMWRDHTYLGLTPKIRYVPDKDLTFPDSNPLFPDKDFRFSSSQIRYFPDRDIWELLGASCGSEDLCVRLRLAKGGPLLPSSRRK